ncbi:hypothetical protein [Tardiphaga sp.]|uniref:TipJ family phage tail tip protein n=1 Tax=Tardiphaga sp. TaxID=1926292 RepID=UPI002603EBAA|nr:hypothetical protein [Tardiphaga sp.]MDB5618475.1 hypothetical protein [Tardiphaga sp.]
MRHEVIGPKAQEGSRLLVLPHLDVSRDRKSFPVGPGTTVAAMVEMAMPGAARDRIRVTIGDDVVPSELWHRVRPRLGATVIIRVVPGNDTLRSVLTVAVLVAAVSLGQFYAPGIAGSIGGALFPGGFGIGGAVAGGSALTSIVAGGLTIGASIAGSLLLDALIPVRGLGDQDKGPDIYAITGLQNRANPGGVVPSILGTHRYAPPYAAPSYTSIIGDDQFVTSVFEFGHGPLVLRNHRLGETPIENFQDVTMEVREGRPDDEPLTLYPQQIVEDQLSVNLSHDDPATMRFTARDAIACTVDIAFVQGLISFDDKGKPQRAYVVIMIAMRKVGDLGGPTPVVTLTYNDQKQKLIRKNYGWNLPSRGQWEIYVWRANPNSTDTKTIDRADWSAIRSIRAESPFNFPLPTARVALRIRASNQLNGIVNNYNADASLICLDWDAASGYWVARETNNPASLYRYVLQSQANAYPKTDDQIDLAGLQDWHRFCETKHLSYNRVHDYDASRLDVLADIAAAGRATPHDDGVKWGVTVDRPQTTYVSAISPRNSWDFQGSTPQVLFPDAHRVQFIDATNGYQQAERVVPFPGVDPAAVAVTEDLSHPGVTNPDQIWRATRRRQYELIHRPHTYSVSQDIESLVLSRGDMAPLNHDVLDRDHIPSRVRKIEDGVVTVDTPVTMEVGRSYACAFRKSDGTSIRRSVVTRAGESPNLTMVGDLSGVEVGDLAMFGTSLRGPVIDVVVKSIERGDNLTAKLMLIDAAPIIDELTDAETPPPWDGRVGEVNDVSALLPAVPDLSVADSLQQFFATVTPGSGSVALPATYVVSHRLHGGGAFMPVTITASVGVAIISGYLVGDIIDVKAHAVTAYGVPSADTAIVQATMHAATGSAPLADSSLYKADTTLITADHF